MHEMSIATGMLQGVLKAAAEHGATRVEEVEVELGAMRLIVPEALEMAWEVLVEGTPAAGSRLKMTEVPIRAKCRECGRTYEAEVGSFACPTCGQADVEIVAGDDIILKSVICWTGEEAPEP